MLQQVKGSMQILRLYLYIKEKSGKVNWSKDRNTIAEAMGVTVSNLRGIKLRALRLGILKEGGKSWIFCVGNHAWICSKFVCTKRKVVIPQEIWSDLSLLRTFVNSIFISNVVWEYGTVAQRGRAVMPCSISYLENTLGWSRYRVVKYRKEGSESGFFKLEKDWEIIASTDWGQSEKEVKDIFTALKKMMPHISGDDFRIAVTSRLHKKGEKVEVLCPSSSIISTSLRCGKG